MIKVLQVIGSLNNGGSQAMIMNIYRNIDRSKIQFDFIIDRSDEQFFSDEIKKLGGKIYVMPIFNLNNLFEFKKAWHKFFKEHPEYKIIHGHVRSTASIYLKIAKEYGVTTIAHSHSTSSGTGFSAIVKNILQYQIRYTADYLIACSKSAGVWLFGEKACKRDNYFVLNNAIDTKKYIYNEKVRNEKREELGIADKFVIGHVGRFNTPKNHKFLIDIFKEVHNRNNNAVLMLVGDGELRHSIEKKVNDLGLINNVIFTGVRADISELLQVMDVFVFPSLYEGLPVTLVEAQAAGLPCVVSDTITNEIYITPYIHSLSLSYIAGEWADIILTNERVSRTDTKHYIKEAGFDICDTVKKLSTFYFELSSL